MASRTQSGKSTRKTPARKTTRRLPVTSSRNGSTATAGPKLNGKCRALQQIGLMMIAGHKDPMLLDQVADLLALTCKYRWVGIYKVAHHDFVLVGSSDAKKPACPEFPVTQGVSAEVYEKCKTVIVRDVSKDKRFIPNFWTTKSEIVAPIVDDEHNHVLGVINAESSRLDAFDKTDRDLLEGAGRLIWRVLR